MILLQIFNYNNLVAMIIQGQSSISLKYSVFVMRECLTWYLDVFLGI